ncbi:MAG: hypothetical protein MUF07_02290 [Steroidobacteraceae bacterium]|jgi:hypothetical protein|nr:hypothetical protein [Steroidobacteraceae bacterium]
MADLLRLDRDPAAALRETAQRAAVRDWTCATLGLGESATVLVTELSCAEPGCPPREVVIAVFAPHAPRRQCRIHCALAELDESRVRAAWLAPTPCGGSHD